MSKKPIATATPDPDPQRRKIHQSPTDSKGTDKIDRYGWATHGSPPELRFVPANEIRFDPSTSQREDDEVSSGKIIELRKAWSWPAAGVILCARRPDGSLYAFDGQHRVLAARGRSDTSMIPCAIYDIVTAEEEALAFYMANCNRRNVSAFTKHRILRNAKDTRALNSDAILRDAGCVFVRRASKPNEASCTTVPAELLKLMCRSAVVRAFHLARIACETDNRPIKAELVKGFGYLVQRVDGAMRSDRFESCVRNAGSVQLMRAVANRKSSAAKSSNKLFGEAMLEVLNYRLRIPFEVGPANLFPASIDRNPTA